MLSLLSTSVLYFLPSSVQIIIAFLLIVSIGLLHGSNDIKIIERLQLSKSKTHYLSISYGLLVLFVLAIFFVIPYIVLPFFILISAYHFGEQHLNTEIESDRKGILNKTFIYLSYLTYGLYIFFILFYVEFEATETIVKDINSRWFSSVGVGYVLIASFFGFIVSLFFAFKKKKAFIKLLGNEFICLVVYLVMFNMSSLIVGFALYFVFWHSLPSLREQQQFLYKDVSFKGFVNYFKDSWKYWLISLVGLIVFMIFFYDMKNIYSILFAFVAAITFPHIIIMQRMFLNQKKQ